MKIIYKGYIFDIKPDFGNQKMDVIFGIRLLVYQNSFWLKNIIFMHLLIFQWKINIIGSYVYDTRVMYFSAIL